MNDQMIENLLRKTPVPKAPVELMQELLAEVCLPRANAARIELRPPQSLARRWLPALAFAALMTTCLVVIGIQSDLMGNMKKEAAQLTAQTQNLESLRQTNAQVQLLRNENTELARLQKDNAELQRLLGEVAQLQAQTADIAELRAENARLQLAARNVPDAPKDFFAEAKGDSEQIQCINNLKQLGLAIRIWAGDNNSLYPSNYICMTNEMNTWKILHCPSDSSRSVTSWADVEAWNVSYPLYSAGCKDSDDPNTVVAECPIHHSVALLDGSVQRLTAESYSQRIKMVNGRKVFRQ